MVCIKSPISWTNLTMPSLGVAHARQRLQTKILTKAIVYAKIRTRCTHQQTPITEQISQKWGISERLKRTSLLITRSVQNTEAIIKKRKTTTYNWGICFKVPSWFSFFFLFFFFLFFKNQIDFSWTSSPSHDYTTLPLKTVQVLNPTDSGLDWTGGMPTCSTTHGLFRRTGR